MNSSLANMFQRLLFPAALLAGPTALWLSVQSGISAEYAALAITITVTVGVGLAEQLLPRNRAWSAGQADTGTDAVSFLVIIAVLEPLIKLLAPLAAATLLLLVARPDGLSLFPGHWALPAQLALFAVLAEFGRYWIHRLSHEHPLLWRIHASHHSVGRLYFFNTFRLHPINHVWNYLFSVFPLLLLGAGETVLLHYFVLSTIVAAFQHANLDLRHGPLNYLFATNELHFWHHAANAEAGNRNYGSVLIIWDLVFGSFLNAPGLPAEVGLRQAQNYPVNSYWKQVLAPFCWRRCVQQPDAADAV